MVIVTGISPVVNGVNCLLRSMMASITCAVRAPCLSSLPDSFFFFTTRSLRVGNAHRSSCFVGGVERGGWDQMMSTTKGHIR